MGTDFCPKCWMLLASHPADRVRAGLAARQDVSLDAQQDLAEDPFAPVAFSARDCLDEITARARRRHANSRSGSED